MATTTRILDANVNGTVYTSNANAALEALDTCHSGATAPTDEVANGKLWLDTTTTPGILKIYNNATWEVVHSGTVDINAGTIDGTVIGGTTPAAVTGTTLTATGAITGTTLTATGAFTSLGIDDNATSTAVTIDSSGHAIIPAGVTLGTAAGVYSAANTLDDYEEGTWTPTFLATGSGPSSITGVTVDEAIYTKIGNFVRVRAKVSLDRAVEATFTVGNYFTLGGLPFIANTLGSTGLFGTIGQCHVYEGLSSNSNAWGFVALNSNGTDYNIFLQTLLGNPDTGDAIFLDMSYTT